MIEKENCKKERENERKEKKVRECVNKNKGECKTG